jgi:tRNA U38,U39,U40 pseudouridine synthase TruA
LSHRCQATTFNNNTGKSIGITANHQPHHQPNRMRHGFFHWLVSVCPWMFLPVLLAGGLSPVQAFSLSEPRQWGQRKPQSLLLSAGPPSGHCQIQPMPNAAAGPPLAAGEDHLHDAGTSSTTEEDEPSFVGAQRSLWLQLSYDGRRFDGGWDDDSASTTSNSGSPLDGKIRTRRSVKSVVQKNLAKLYGNLALSRIGIQSTVPSLDPGVHAVGLVVQVFGIIAAALEGPAEENAVVSAYTSSSNDDSLLLPLPMSPDRMCRALNRMCQCQDVQIKAYSYHAAAGTGTTSSRDGFRRPAVFFSHPRTVVTTYSYRLSFGPRPDPILRHYVWHIVLHHHHDDNALANTVPPVTIMDQLQAACDRLVQQQQQATTRSSSSAVVDRLDHMMEMVVSRWPNDNNDDHWHGSTGGRCEVTITGRRLTDRTARAHVAKVVAAAVSASGFVANQSNTTTPTTPTLLSATLAPAHGLVLVNVQYDNSDDNNNNNDQDSWVWHAAKR